MQGLVIDASSHGFACPIVLGWFIFVEAWLDLPALGQKVPGQRELRAPPSAVPRPSPLSLASSHASIHAFSTKPQAQCYTQWIAPTILDHRIHTPPHRLEHSHRQLIDTPNTTHVTVVGKHGRYAKLYRTTTQTCGSCYREGCAQYNVTAQPWGQAPLSRGEPPTPFLRCSSDRKCIVSRLCVLSPT